MPVVADKRRLLVRVIGGQATEPGRPTCPSLVWKILMRIMMRQTLLVPTPVRLPVPSIVIGEPRAVFLMRRR